MHHSQKIRYNNKTPEYSEVLYLLKAVYFLCEYYGISAGYWSPSGIDSTAVHIEYSCIVDNSFMCHAAPASLGNSGGAVQPPAEGQEPWKAVRGYGVIPSRWIAAHLLRRPLHGRKVPSNADTGSLALL